jgi:hypothetical protein
MVLFVLFGLLSSQVKATPIAAGTYTIPTDYATLSAAFTALNTNGIAGPVIINCPKGSSETNTTAFAITLGSATLNATLSSTNTITIQSTGTGANYKVIAGTGGLVSVTATTQHNGIIALLGADYVTFDGIDVAENSSNSGLALMEYGYALYKLSATDGCNNNTIKNCTIVLNRLNNTAATTTPTGPTVSSDGSTGILLTNTTQTTPLTLLTPTAATGASSNNKFYTNVVNNCNVGMCLMGYSSSTSTTLVDQGNDIGGTTLATGNSVLDFGGGGTAAMAMGIYCINQYGINVQYTTINNNDGIAVGTGTPTNHVGTATAASYNLIGIWNNTAAQSSTSPVNNITLKNNTISLQSATATAGIISCAIKNDGGSAGSATINNTVDMSNNTVTGCHTALGSFYGIYNTTTPNKLKMNSNTVTGNYFDAISSSSTWYSLYNTGAVVTSSDFNSNTINGSQYTSASASASPYYLIYNTGAAVTTCTNSVNTNTLTASYWATNTLTSTGIFGFIYCTGAHLLDVIQNNTIGGGNTLNTNSTIYFVYCTGASQSKTVSNNTINNVGRVTGLATAGSGTVYGYYLGSSSTTFFTTAMAAASTLNCFNNTFTNYNNQSTGSTIYGFYVNGCYNVNCYNNEEGNITCLSTSTATCYGLYTYYYGVVWSIHDNSIHDIQCGTGTMYCWYNYHYYSYQVDGYNNNFWNINGAQATTYCLYTAFNGFNYPVTSTSTVNASGNYYRIRNNKWFNISTSNTTTSTVIYCNYAGSSSGTGAPVNVYNNVWTDLRAPNSTCQQAIIGAYLGSNVFYNFRHNSIYATGTFGAAGGAKAIQIYAGAAAPTVAVNIQNNIFDFNCTPGTGGYVMAEAGYSSAHIAGNANVNINNNIYYFGSSANSYAYGVYAGSATSSAITPTGLLATVGAMSAATGKDGSSATENLSGTFASVLYQPSNTASVASVSGNASVLLNIAGGSTTQAESGGAAALGINIDASLPIGNTRATYTGYSGSGTAPDCGAYEFNGSSPAPLISSTAATPTGYQCVTTSRAITCIASAPSGCSIDATGTTVATSGVFIDYTINGGATISVRMTNTGGNNWSGTLPASVPTNATIVWSCRVVDYLTATPSSTFSKSAAGASYTDDPYNGVLASFAMSPNPVCALAPTTLSVTAGGPTTIPTGYGTSNATATADDEILSVNLGSGSSFTNLLSNTASCGATGATTVLNGLPASIPYEYSNYTNLTTVPTLVGGNTYNYSVTIGYCTSGTYSSAFAIYIDYNRDGTFNTTTEKVAAPAYATAAFAGTAYTGTFTVPTTGINSGYSLMRVVDQESTATPSPTGTYSWGEAEDYRVNLVGAGFTAYWTSNSNAIGNSTSTTYQYAPAGSGGNTESVDLYLQDASGCQIHTAAPQTLTINTIPTAPTSVSSTQCGSQIPTASVATTNTTGATGQFFWYNSNNAITGVLQQAPPLAATVSTYYTNNFTSSTLTNSSLSGAAAISGGVAALKPATTSTQGGITVNAPNNGVSATQLQVDYDMTLTATGTTIADGYGYSWGDDAAAGTTTPSAEHGNGSKLRIGFMTYNAANGTDGKGIYLAYGTSATSYVSSPLSTGLLAYSSNVAWIPTSTTPVSAHVTININALGQLTMSVGGTAIFTNVQLPAAYLAANNSTWKHVIDTRSGGVAGGFTLDNLVIKSNASYTAGYTTYQTPVAASTTWYVSEAGTNGCSSARTPVSVGVTYGDVVSANSSATSNTVPGTVCLGNSFTLQASQTGTNGNAYNYTWNCTSANAATSGLASPLSGGSSTAGATTLTVTPTAAGTYVYNVYANDGTCASNTTRTITVAALPVVLAPFASATTVCAGTAITAYAGGGSQTAPTGYGLSNATSTTDDEIFNVNISCVGGGTLNNTSSCSTTGSTSAINGLPASIQEEYSNYTNLPATNLILGQAVTGSVTVGYCGTSPFGTRVSIYIDYDRNGVFNSTNELAYTTTYTTGVMTGTSYPVSFTVPLTASPGMTVMRVTDQETSAVPAATGTYSWGETEDYLVNIFGGNPANTYSWNFGTSTGVATGGGPVTITPASATAPPAVQTTQNLLVIATDPSTGCQATSPSTVITVNPIPSVPTLTAGGHCGANLPTCVASSNSGLTAPQFTWYSAVTAGTTIQAANVSTTITTPTTATANYWITETVNGCVSSPRVTSATAPTEVVTQPDAATAGNTAPVAGVCLGGSVNLTATKTGTASGNNYTVVWTASPATGSGIATTLAGGVITNTSLSNTVSITPTAAGTYIYTATMTDGTVAPVCQVIKTTTVIVLPLPLVPTITATPTTICSTDSVHLNVTAYGGASAGSGSGGGTAPTYCAVTNQGSSVVIGFTINTLNFSSAGATASPYYNINAATGANTTSLIGGLSYTTTMTTNGSAITGVWIDFNGNGVFDATTNSSSNPSGEFVQPYLTGTTATWTYYVPVGGASGLVGVRVRSRLNGNILGVADGCTALGSGSTEDFFVTILPPYTFNWTRAYSLVSPTSATTIATTVNTAFDNPNNTSTTTSRSADYLLTVTGSNGCSSASNAVSVSINPSPAAPTASPASTQCGLALPNVSVSNGTGTHVWSWYAAATGGLPLQSSTSNKYTTPINTTTSFYVSQVSTTSGCESYPRTLAIANVTTPNPIAITNNIGNNNNCWGTALSLTAAKSPNTGVNVYSYKWCASPLTGSGLANCTTSGATITPTPTIPGTYVYTATATDATLGCVTTATITITQLPDLTTATVSTQAPTTCGSNGSILISPAITTAALTTLYQNNFATSVFNSTFEYVCGTPTPTSNGSALILTANTVSQEGNYEILNANNIDADIWQTEFDLTTVGAAGADGFSYNFGDNVSPVCTTNGGQEVGSGTKLHLAFDAYTNGSNVAGIYLTYGTITNTGGHYPPNTPSVGSNPDVLGYANDVTWLGGNTSHVTLTINAGGQVTVTMGSTTLFNNVQLPAAYLAASKATWNHLFMARTGGISQGHQLGNVSVKYIPRNYQYSNNFTATTPTWQNASSFTAPVGTYPMGIKSNVNSACSANLGNAVISITPTLTASASSLTGCPGSLTVLSFTPALTSYTYQWQSSTTSATTGFSNISGATAATLTWGVPATSTWYRIGVTCAGNTTYSNAVNLAASSSAATIPFLEDFESITTANTLPNCMSYGSGNANLMILGQDLYTPSYTTYSTTYTSQQNHTSGGSKYASFYYYNSNGSSYANDRYVYTQAIHMVGGQTYRASVWYANDNAGATGNWNINLKYGPSQSPTGMTNIVSKTGILATTYNVLTQLAGTFTPATTGDYVIAVEVTNAAYSYYALSIDDIEVLSPCSGTPSATIPTNVSVCTGQSTTLNATTTGYGYTYQWEYSLNGINTWANVVGGSGATTATYTTPTTLPGSSTYYRCKVTCTGSSLFAYTNTCLANNIICQFNIARTTGITYNDISTSPTVQHPTWVTINPDDGITNAIALPSGFNFTFYGKTVTSVRMCTNGWMTLDGAGVTGGQTTYTGNFTTNTTPMSVVAPWWCDLQTPGYPTVTGQSSLDAGIWYDVQGTAPNRVAIFEWKGIEKYYNPGPDLNFQVKLYESSNQANHKIEIVHGTMLGQNGTVNNYYYAAIGIKSANISTTPQNGECYVLQDLNTNRFDKAEPTTSYFYSVPQCNESYMFIPGTGYTMPAAPSTAPPVNDNPTGAISLALNGGPCTDMCYKYYNTQYATASGNTVCTGGTQANADDDIWFSITLPSTPTIGSTGIGITVNAGYGFIPKYEIWNSSLTSSIACQAGTVGLNASNTYAYGTGANQLTSGNTYYIRVFNDGSGFNSYGGAGSGYDGVFGICTYENFPPPANDDPCGAYALTSTTGTACTLTNYTSVSATQTATKTGLVVPASVCSGGISDDDVWFTYTASNPTASIYVQGNGTYDPAVELYTATGSCTGTLTLVASSTFGASCTNATGTGGLETVNLTNLVTSPTPTKLYIRVYHKTAGFASGSFGICILSNTPPVNDACANATSLTFGTSCNPTAATSAYATLSQAVSASCSSTNPDDDVWFTVTRPSTASSMNIVVTGSANYDPVFEVFTGSVCGSLTSLGCVNTNSNSSNATESKLYTGLLALQTTYRIRVYNAAAGFGSGTFSICVYSGTAPANVIPCASINASANSGYVAGVSSTVVSAYDNGSSVYAGQNNNNVLSNPPSGPSLVYYTGSTAYAYAFTGEPTPSCGTVATTQKPVWYKFRVPTFTAGVTLRSVTTYGQSMTPILAAYVLAPGAQLCNNPSFTQVGCSSSGTLTLTSTTLNPYIGSYIYVQLQGTATVPSGNYTLSVQGIVNGVTLTNPTTTTLRVNFPSFSAPAPGKYVVYWRKVGATGANYVNLSPTSNYTIGGLTSNQTYEVWVKFVDISTTTGSQIFCAKASLATTAGCGGNLSAPLVTGATGHCSVVSVTWPSPSAQGVPTLLIPAASTYPYRLVWSFTSAGSFHGFVQAIASLPSTGYGISGLQLSQNYSFYYTFKCVGGALMTSYTTPYATCSGPARLNTHTEYVIGGVHYVDATEEELMNALTANVEDDGQVHEFNLVNIANQEETNQVQVTSVGNFELIPNPTSNTVSVNYSLPAANLESVMVKVMDVQGKVVREEKIQTPNQYGNVKFDLSDVEAGVYLVNIQTEGYTETKKLVVSK